MLYNLNDTVSVLCSGGMSVGKHLFTFRTEKLSPLEPMILLRGKVGYRQDRELKRKENRRELCSRRFFHILLDI